MALVKPHLHFRIGRGNRKMALADAFHDPGFFTRPLIKGITVS